MSMTFKWHFYGILDFFSIVRLLNIFTRFHSIAQLFLVGFFLFWVICYTDLIIVYRIGMEKKDLYEQTWFFSRRNLCVERKFLNMKIFNKTHHKFGGNVFGNKLAGVKGTFLNVSQDVSRLLFNIIMSVSPYCSDWR